MKRITTYVLTLSLLSTLITGCGNSSGAEPQEQKSNTPTLTTEGKNSPNQHEIGEFTTQAPVSDVTSSKETLILAEGDGGVEIYKIGYNDKIEHELISTISGINAKNISLSPDHKKLYVQNNEGYVNIFNISNIKEPKREQIITQNLYDNYPTSKDGTTQYLPKGKEGLETYDISNPSQKRLLGSFKEIAVYALTLIQEDTKAIVATKDTGIALLDVSNPAHIYLEGKHPIEGETLGVSTNEELGLLFVANGDKGVKVYNLALLLAQMQ